jgi:hypothetical protein
MAPLGRAGGHGAETAPCQGQLQDTLSWQEGVALQLLPRLVGRRPANSTCLCRPSCLLHSHLSMCTVPHNV